MEILDRIAGSVIVIAIYTTYTLFNMFSDIVLWLVLVADIIAYGNVKHLYTDVNRWVGKARRRILVAYKE